MTRPVNPDSPAVVVFVDPAYLDTALLTELLAGLEEEGVPARVRPAAGSAVAMAHQAALESPLEVGLGLDRRGAMALHHRRTQPDRPLFATGDSPVDGLVARDLGVSAARLVKVQPLRFPSGER
ncbi:MAG TPA: glycerol dehydratase reactivase beta/small subunit family protein [Symbiobacteriaceae bacterium]|nr:glycerol dehydratase reactivase beta/small subunit family protein [Symbiobacteriaceae bacterium]